MFLVGLSRAGPPWSIDPTAFITLAIAGLIELLVFIPVGWLLAIIPCRFAAERIRHARYSGRWYLLAGLMVGVVATPICAAVAWLPQDPDAPTYAARFLEYIAPMVVAGLAGGICYWRCVGARDQRAERISDVF